MAGIVIEPRLIYLELSSGRFYYKALPMGESSFIPLVDDESKEIDYNRKGARLRDELHFNVDRTRGLSLSSIKSDLDFLKFAMRSTHPRIFKHHHQEHEFFRSKIQVSRFLFKKFIDTPGRNRAGWWWSKHQAPLNSLKNIHDRKVTGRNFEFWSLFHPLKEGNAGITKESMTKRIKRLAVAHSKPVRTDFYVGGGGKPLDGILPLGIAFRTRLYLGKLPQGVVDNVQPRHGAQATELVKDAFFGGDKKELWTAVVKMANPHAKKDLYTLTPRGMSLAKNPDSVTIRTYVVPATSEGMARRKLTAEFLRRIKLGGDRGGHAHDYYELWFQNDFKVVPHTGTTPYRQPYRS